MNGSEQKSHKGRSDELAVALLATTEASLNRFKSVEERLTHLEGRVGELRYLVTGLSVRLQTGFEASVERDLQVKAALNAFAAQGFWTRVGWLLGGR